MFLCRPRRPSYMSGHEMYRDSFYVHDAYLSTCDIDQYPCFCMYFLFHVYVSVSNLPYSVFHHLNALFHHPNAFFHHGELELELQSCRAKGLPVGVTDRLCGWMR